MIYIGVYFLIGVFVYVFFVKKKSAKREQVRSKDQCLEWDRDRRGEDDLMSIQFLVFWMVLLLWLPFAILSLGVCILGAGIDFLHNLENMDKVP